MYYGNEDDSLKNVVKDVVDMLCGVISSESLRDDNMIATNDHIDGKEPTCSSSKDFAVNSSSVSEENDDNWTARHYRMGIASFLKQDSRLEGVSSRKRSVSVLSEKESGNISSCNITVRIMMSETAAVIDVQLDV
ncbi:unnamed protein product [Wuchereria bancrofti]|uniref:Uncharacterized protein n=1 Tax=Wuchereria bancrofti TaxID=6293 RepID=A0A3P7DYI6_WUCBA|nr:unnamed protein product [Wuchereria bancrofti]